MNESLYEQVGFDILRESLASYCVSAQGKQRTLQLQPHKKLGQVKQLLVETEEVRKLLDANLHIPFMGLVNIEQLSQKVMKGFILQPEELVEYADFLRSIRLVRQYFEKNQFLAPQLAAYSQGLTDFLAIEEAIYTAVKNNQIVSEASRELGRARRKIAEIEAQIEQRLQKFLNNPENKSKIQDSYIAKKAGHYTIPIKATYKNQISGTVIETSNRGTTVFIEPQVIQKLVDEIVLQQAIESSEIYQISATLTGLLAEQQEKILFNLDMIIGFDMIFARGKYSRMLAGMTPRINQVGSIKFMQVVHPLLDNAVPLDIEIGNDFRGLVITGANAGGKTVVLKTLALISLQVMIGMQIKASQGTEVAIFDAIFVDIGDQQSLTNALSTFSGHLKNIAEIIAHSNQNSLVLLDEIGSGTEPNEGAALAIAMLETFYQKGCMVVATTHYGEIKRFAENHLDFTTAAMTFDLADLSPKYQVLLHQTGESHAFWLAKRMKLPAQVIQKAGAYMKTGNYDFSIYEAAEQAEKLTPTNNQQIEQLCKGDKVLDLETKKSAIVYEDTLIHETTVKIFMDEVVHIVAKKRVQLQIRASELYPQDYDFNQLFTAYEERKQQRDLARGSKKAQKQLDKEMRLRRK